MNVLDAALQYLQTGYSVVPLERGSKKALVRWKPYQEKRATPEIVTKWFTRWPDANIGIITGAISGIFVVDVDSSEGLQALQSRGEWSSEPDVRTSKIGHYYFRYPAEPVRNAAGILPGVDIRGEGGLVAAPPSVHHSGVLYEWVSPEPPQDAPEWLIELLHAEKPKPEIELPEPQRTHLNGHANDPDQAQRFVAGCLRSEVKKIQEAPDGNKHAQLLKSATYLAGYIPMGAISEDEIRSTLFDAVSHRAEDKQNALDTIRDGIKYGSKKPLNIPPPRAD